ncbi:hypothetical protein SLS62_000629 [Diatrype stigma]|uniref:Uncharacterized protein n=1 Tax=Diatrype stigma TaxID=117547 RepID=A0AAN9UXW4_9PEZI
MSTRKPDGPMFNTVNYGDKSMGGRKVEARVPGRRPGLQIDTKAASDRTRPIAEAPKTGGLARDPHAHELDNRGWYDADTDHRAAAPWATPEAFTPVGPEGAFTPMSMLAKGGYFPRAEGAAAVPKRNSNNNRGGTERRPTRGRLQSAPAQLANRRQISHSPQTSSPLARDAATATTHGSPRRQTMPLTPARRPVPPPPSKSLAPELLHPQPRSPGRSSHSRSSVSGASLKQSAGYAIIKGVEAFKSLASRSHQKKGKDVSYQGRPSLAEDALMQGEYVLYAADFADMQAREVSNFSPTSCEQLYRATSDRIDPAEKERAARAFAARQQVHYSKEAQAQAALTRRETERAKARAKAGDVFKATSTSTFGWRMTIEEEKELYRMQAESLHEAQARLYIEQEKDKAQRMALEHPERYPGLGRR